MSMLAQLLVVEDEADLREFLCTTLRAHGYQVRAAGSCAEARVLAQEEVPDMVLLDLGLPDGDGHELITEFRSLGDIPVLVLSARDQEKEKITALDEGAEDYLTKPFSTGELLARLRVLLRRLQPEARRQEYALNGLHIDIDHHRVLLNGEAVHLTPIEFDLLAALAKGEGRVMTHTSLMQAVWGERREENTHYLRIYMRQLRNKLEADPTQPRYLKTVPGVGYCLSFD